MRACEACKHRTETCHAECAAYLAEHILGAHEGRDRLERVTDDYISDSIERGARRATGKRTYKSGRSHNWKDEAARFGR